MCSTKGEKKLYFIDKPYCKRILNFFLGENIGKIKSIQVNQNNKNRLLKTYYKETQKSNFTLNTQHELRYYNGAELLLRSYYPT